MTHLDHSVWLVDWVEDIGIAGVVLVGDAVPLQREGNVVDVRHAESNLHIDENDTL